MQHDSHVRAYALATNAECYELAPDDEAWIEFTNFFTTYASVDAMWADIWPTT